MKEIRISPEIARSIALKAQLLDGGTKLPKGKEGVVQTIENLGYVQIDTINIIERAHNHTLWTRRPDYKPEMLHELQSKDRRVFEYWGHAASYLPTTDYRYYIPMMRSFADPKSKWVQGRLKKFGHLMDPILERIRNEGALASRDFETLTDKSRGTWWDWRPAKVALELLFWKGELMITERRNFQRVYDLTERVLPAHTDTNIPGDDKMGRFFVSRALSAYGVATEKEICNHIHAAGKKIIINAIQDFIDSGEVMPVKIVGDDKSDYYAFSEVMEKSIRVKRKNSALHLLSPFDNLIIQRDRIKRLFDFDYALECYVPKGKRKLGYFVLPILWGDKFVGRLDSKADRKKKVLAIKSLGFEKGFKDFEKLLPPLTDKLKDFARFNKCESIELEKVLPVKVKSELKRQLNS
ncbi:MAG: YcaQ family DNA glycosylase [Ignavibacteria bacterium]|nr:YcaQ family DNA glycosylase [Ignavibacteria bacterium]